MQRTWVDWLGYACWAWLVIQIIINFRERQKIRSQRRREAKERYAHCQCGQRMSEWFIKDGYMWHPEFAHGCGWVSPWVDHEHYRETRQQQKVIFGQGPDVL